MEQQLDLFLDADSDEMVRINFVKMDSKIVKIRKGVFSRIHSLTKLVLDQEKEIESINQNVQNLQKQIETLLNHTKIQHVI